MWRKTGNGYSVPSVTFGNAPYKSVLVANATLLLLSAATYFLKRQIDRKSKVFLNNGGFSERMTRMRLKNRAGDDDPMKRQE